MSNTDLAVSLSKRFNEAYPVVAAGNTNEPHKLETARYHLMGAARAYGVQMTRGREGFDVNVAADMAQKLKQLRDTRFSSVMETLNGFVDLEIEHHL